MVKGVAKRMFVYGKASESRLALAEPKLALVFRHALTLSVLDITITESIRSVERQRQLVASGSSRTMNSRHLPNARGLSEAIDAAGIDPTTKEVSWKWPHVYQVARAVQQAAKDLQTKVRWGCVWDKVLNDLDEDLEHEHALYVVRFKEANKGKNAFSDGPHFELL